MSTLIIVNDDTITFSTRRMALDGYMPYKLSVEEMYTPYGFFIPIGRTGEEALNVMAGKSVDWDSGGSEELGELITHDGDVVRYMRDQSRWFIWQVWKPGKGKFTCSCLPSNQNQMVGMAMHLTGYDVKKSLELLNKIICIPLDDYVTLKISDITKNLKAKGFTKEPCGFDLRRAKPFEEPPPGKGKK